MTKQPAARGRKPGFTMSPEHRVKIQNSKILKYLIDHVEGKREMSSTQVTAGLGLLKKVLPDLTHNEHASDPDNPIMMPTLIALVPGDNSTD